MLIHPDPFKPFVVEADASNYAIGAVLSQRDESGDLHPVAFHSRLLKGPEINYPILDKELLAVKVAFEVWRHHLEGARCIVEVLSDHKNLEYFRTAKVESQRHARWSLFFDRFQFLINYVAGKDNGRADALSRRPDYADAYNPEFGQQLLPEWVHTTREGGRQLPREQPLARGHFWAPVWPPVACACCISSWWQPCSCCIVPLLFTTRSTTFSITYKIAAVCCSEPAARTSAKPVGSAQWFEGAAQGCWVPGSACQLGLFGP